MNSLNKINKPVIGWICTYVPEEIIIAAGFHSYRITGNYNSIKNADLCMPSNFCPFARKCIDVALDGGYDFLDGIIFTNSCHAMEQLRDSWKRYTDTPFVYILDVPRIITHESELFFRKHLYRLRDAIEDHFDIGISDKLLSEAIHICSDTRKIWKKIYTHRTSSPPKISGTEIMKLVTLQKEMYREAFNLHLEYVSENLSVIQHSDKEFSKKRILVIGSIIGEEDIIKVIEEENADVVFEDTCSTQRYFEYDISPVEDRPMDTIAERYLNKPGCPRMSESNKSYRYLEEKIREYSVDGVIYYALKFCSVHSIEAVMIKNNIEHTGVPFLFLEGHYTHSDIEQSRNRISAFIDIL